MYPMNGGQMDKSSNRINDKHKVPIYVMFSFLFGGKVEKRSETALSNVCLHFGRIQFQTFPTTFKWMKTNGSIGVSMLKIFLEITFTDNERNGNNASAGSNTKWRFYYYPNIKSINTLVTFSHYRYFQRICFFYF